jgi:arylsulfatase A-like enzyme
MKILVITPNRLHLGYLGCYGNGWIDTPSLDALAAESVVFDHHYSDCPSTLGAWRAWRTGRYDFSASDKSPQDSFDVISALQARGIRSLLVTDCQPANDGWQKVRLMPDGKTDKNLGEKILELVLETIHQLDSSEHGLVWVETNVLAPPWQVDESSCDYFSPDTDEESADGLIEPLSNPTTDLVDASDEMTFLRLQRTYAAAVSQLDRTLGQLCEELRRHDLYDSLMIIVTSDRGFSLGEHGLVGDSRPWLYEELVHVPLILRMPHGVAGGGRIGALTQPVDLMPTLLEAFGLTSVDCHGSSLLPLIRGDQERVRDFSCSGLEIGGEVECSLRTPDWALLLPGNSGSEDLALRSRQLYVKPDDRWEVNNVLQHHLELGEQLEQTLRAFVKNPTSQARIATPV